MDLQMLTLTVLIALFASSMSENAHLQVLQANAGFTMELYQSLIKESPGNLIFSPISIHAVLSMALQGAQGSTAERLSAVLKVPNAQVAAEGYSPIITSMNAVEQVSLLMANRVYVMEGHQLLENFNSAITKNFHSTVQSVDFAKNIEAAKTINTWVEEQTQDKIKDLIQKDDLNQLTRLVLVNAIYFKGDWLHKFDKANTKLEPFYINEEKTIDVDMMHIKRKFHYKASDELDAQILELPYTNKNLSMIIILPNKKDGIQELEAQLKTVSLSEVMRDWWHTEVIVSLPRFKIEKTIELNTVLAKMGLEEIFDANKANFKGIIPLQGAENLYVSKVIQKAFIEVNEEGAEAAAATGVLMGVGCSMPAPPAVFRADHPFIFLLVHRSLLEVPIFGGKLSEL